jgi:type I restriction enzyme R subunit
MSTLSGDLDPIQAIPVGLRRLGDVVKSVHFEFLRPRWPVVASLGGFAEHYCFSDPESSLVKLRKLAEEIVEEIYTAHGLKRPAHPSLIDLLNDRTFVEAVPPVVLSKFHLVRTYGNKGAHAGSSSSSTALSVLRECFEIAKWFYIAFAGGNQSELPQFAPPKPGAGEESKAALKKEKKAVIEKLAAQEAQMAELLKELEDARQREQKARKVSAELSAKLAAAQESAQRSADALGFDEKETRRRLIDSMLKQAGWDVNNPELVRVEEPVKHQPTQSGEGFADYVLLGRDGRPLAVVEAKKTTANADRGREQAKCYADGFEKMYGQRPVIYYTNGYDLNVWNDAENEPPRQIFGYHSPDSLEYRVSQRKTRMPAKQIAPDSRIADRMYQIEAIKRVIERFGNRYRRSLIVQATGTGKTRVAISLCEALIRAGWVRRVLFLCDRKELRRQADQVFQQYLPNEPRIIVRSGMGSGSHTDRIYLATYPAMMQCHQDFDAGYFDLIIADESHRSIYNRYRDLFLYFDAMQVGLTATPVQFISRNTFQLFGCDNQDPTALFRYEDAINHIPPYLVPFRVKTVTTGFLTRGIKYSEMSAEQREELEDQEREPELIEYEQRQVDKAIFNKDTSRKIIKNLMENGIRDGSGSLVGKSIIFARSHEHAVMLQSVFDEMYPQYAGRVCRVIDNYEPRAESLIDQFKDPASDLRIAVSVDMLDTGIDVPEVVNLVFAKPVYSCVKFWQMIGRGTRLCPNLFGPGRHKTEFQIFDHWENFKFFDEAYQEAQPAKQTSMLERLFTARLTLADECLRKPDLAAFNTVAALIAADIADLPTDSISVREKWRQVEACRPLDVIKRFDPAIRATLSQDVAPLMQWRDVRGDTPAYEFDQLVALAQIELLRGSPKFADRRAEIEEWIGDLQYNLNPVREREVEIKEAKSQTFWDNATIASLERMRIALRPITKYRQPRESGRVPPKVIDVREDPGAIQSRDHRPKLEGLEFVAYRQRVEGVLNELFAQNATLRRIKAGQPVSEADLKALVSLVLTQHPDLDLSDLTEYYPETAGHLDLAIRSIIGLDAQAVQERFTGFVRKHTTLNSGQLRFLNLLQNHIAKYGAIEVDRLYEQPFTAISADGLDGVFDDESQIADLLGILESFKRQSPPAPAPDPGSISTRKPDNTTPGNESSPR